MRYGSSPPIVLHDDPRRPMQIASTGIVAQALPRLEYLLQVGRCQGLDGGEARHPAREVVLHRGHARLLRHGLADPYGVRVALARRRVAPGQIALLHCVPVGQTARYLGGSHWTCVCAGGACGAEGVRLFGNESPMRGRSLAGGGLAKKALSQ